MACTTKICKACGEMWMDNGEIDYCKCGSKSLIVTFDEEVDDILANFEMDEED